MLRAIVSSIVYLVVFGLILAAYLVAARISPFYFVDDAFIAFRYAANLLAGRGLVFNPGAAPVEGFSSPLFVLLLAGAGRILGWVPLAGTILGVVFHAATILLTAAFIRRIAGERLWAPFSLFAILFVALHTTMVAYAESGLETSLASFLLLALLFAAARATTDGGRAWTPLTAVLFILLALTRPETLVLAVPLALWLALAARPGRGVRVATFLAIAALGFGAFLLWRHAYFGRWLPNTYDATVAGAGLSLVRRGLGYLWTYINITLFPYLLLVVALFAARVRARLPGWVYGVAAVVLTHVAAVVWVGGDHLPLGRFLVPIAAPLLVVLVAVTRAARQAANRLNPGLAATRLRPVAWLALIAFLPVTMLFALRFHDAAVSFIRAGQRAAAWCELGRVLGEQWPAETTIAALPIGALGFCSGLPIVDLVGRTDPVIARAPTNLAAGAPGYGRYDSRYVLDELRPDLVLLEIDAGDTPLPQWYVRHIVVQRASRDLIANAAFVRNWSFHRRSFGEVYLHYWSRNDFEDPAQYPADYPIIGAKNPVPPQEPPPGSMAAKSVDRQAAAEREFDVPEGWEVW